ncbi:MAG: GNAT family N-acetyltransferase [Streptosporangiaceae bacterium]
MTARYSRPALGDHERVEGSQVQIRAARTGDAGAVAGLAGEPAPSFPFSRDQFDPAYPALAGSEDACLLVAAGDGECLGYVLGFRHLTFYANGPVGWVEELLVRQEHQGRGLGRRLLPGPGLRGISGLPAQSTSVTGTLIVQVALAAP